ncbi:unnamed protein product [Psylliodes chrysocephalus]|uniref:Peptidase S1 domain-containing protein n=1 Tax=Psylliodes chrysocephalus TaxID=3402493 RepID=A0A9P0CL99_9CUCU|nr:unnamed protein product [Psylliodes chrysocephala]
MFSAKVVIFLAAVAVCYGAPNARLRQHHLQIDGGHPAKIQEYPFIASVQWCVFGCEHTCGAVIVNESWVLTAAGCIEDTLSVAVGTANLQGTDGILVDVASSHVHPDAPEDGVGPNDLALLKLAKPLTFNDKVQAAKLPTQGQEFTGKAVVTGYSYTDDPSVNTLQAALNLELISNADCKKQLDIFYPGKALLDDNANVCTLSETSNHCYADFGSPLSQDGTVIGTATWYVLPCGAKGAPNVYTKLSNYADWIAQTIAAN